MSDKRWVCGFAFYKHKEATFVVLIEKKSGPTIIVDHFNGVGGKIETQESPDQAMRREFREEAGVDIWNWRCFGILKVQDYGEVVMYTVDLTDEQLRQVRPMEAEPVCICEVSRLPSRTFKNLQWLIPMALDREHIMSTMEIRYER